MDRKAKELQLECSKLCKNVLDKSEKDHCYSMCVFLYDYNKCMNNNGIGRSGISQCSPNFFGPDASFYGQLPKYYGELPK